jgi:hypothetical protein
MLTIGLLALRRKEQQNKLLNAVPNRSRQTLTFPGIHPIVKQLVGRGGHMTSENRMSHDEQLQVQYKISSAGNLKLRFLSFRFLPLKRAGIPSSGEDLS